MSGGIFYDSWAGMNQMMQAQGHTWPDVGQQQSGNLNTPTSGNPVPGVSAKNPFPAGLLPGPTHSTGWPGMRIRASRTSTRCSGISASSTS